jgi:glycosyltransferase involved in cell wall biosynthesis
VVIPLGIDLKPFQKMPPPGLFTARFPESAGRPVVLFLSRLDPKKNVEALLDGFSLLLDAKSDPDQSPPILVIAGSGDPGYVMGLQARASDLGIQKNVIWTGHLKGNLKLSALAACDLFVLPSRSENFGIALLEAMAAGCACLSTEGVALAAESAGSGAVKLCEPQSVSIEEAVETLLAHASERATLSRNAAAVVARKYSLENSVDSVVELYKQSVALT